jgi:hypothetical protein
VLRTLTELRPQLDRLAVVLVRQEGIETADVMDLPG